MTYLVLQCVTTQDTNIFLCSYDDGCHYICVYICVYISIEHVFEVASFTFI